MRATSGTESSEDFSENPVLNVEPLRRPRYQLAAFGQRLVRSAVLRDLIDPAETQSSLFLHPTHSPCQPERHPARAFTPNPIFFAKPILSRAA